MNNATIIIVVFLALIILGIFVVPRIMMKRALKQVVSVFRNRRATNSSNAKTLQELGLQPHTLMEKMFKARDYRPYAIDFLERSGIIVAAEDGKMYLLEDKLPENLKDTGS